MMLQPAGRQSKRKRQPEEDQNTLDPIALTLALWLGIVVVATGLVRLAQDAARDEALAQAGQPVASAPNVEISPFTHV